jgi:Fic family protein
MSEEQDISSFALKPYVPFPSFSSWTSVKFNQRTFDIYAEQLANVKINTPLNALKSALDVATRWAAVDTGAIEGLYDVDRGFTFTVAASSIAWSDIHVLKDESAAHAMEDALKAYDLVLDAATRTHPVTEQWIKELHTVICASQGSFTVLTDLGQQERELRKGEYKSEPNNPLNRASKEIHGYASPIDTGPEMARLIGELRSDSFLNAHPVLQSAYAHYAFVCIHPFPDGNGRVARGLASVYLYRNPGIPLVIFADQKGEYLNALEDADAGNSVPFVQFISDRGIDTIGMLKTQVERELQPDIQHQMKSMQGVLTGRGGLSHVEVDAIATRLLEEFQKAFERQIAENPVSPPLGARVSRTGQRRGPIPENYRHIPQNSSHNLEIQVVSGAPQQANAGRHYEVAVAGPDIESSDFVIVFNGQVVLEVFLREIHPAVSTALDYRMNMIALAEYRILVQEGAHMATESLRANGYLK